MVHDEADQLEHAVSDRVLERMDALLGHPTVDPHGDPIPSAKGQLHDPALKSLADCPMGISQRVARVLDQDPAFFEIPGAARRLIPGATRLRLKNANRNPRR